MKKSFLFKITYSLFFAVFFVMFANFIYTFFGNPLTYDERTIMFIFLGTTLVLDAYLTTYKKSRMASFIIYIAYGWIASTVISFYDKEAGIFTAIFIIILAFVETKPEAEKKEEEK